MEENGGWMCANEWQRSLPDLDPLLGGRRMKAGAGGVGLFRLRLGGARSSRLCGPCCKVGMVGGMRGVGIWCQWDAGTRVCSVRKLIFNQIEGKFCYRFFKARSCWMPSPFLTRWPLQIHLYSSGRSFEFLTGPLLRPIRPRVVFLNLAQADGSW